MRKLSMLLLGIIMLFARQVQAQNSMTCAVKNANGLRVPGATIKIENSRPGTTAGTNCTFYINTTSKAVFIISAVGLETKKEIVFPV